MNFSICMTTYNGDKYLAEQLDSIICQLSPEDELLISDDGSNDKSIAIIKSYQNKFPALKIKLFYNSFKSVIKNFNFVLSKATKEIIVLADQDDIWEMNKLDVVKKEFTRDKRLKLLVHDCKILKNNEIDSTTFFQLRKSGKGVVKNIFKNSYIGCCISFKKELLSIALPIPKYMTMHDLWLGLIAEIYGKVKFLDKSLLYYRRHDQNESEDVNQSKNSLQRKALDRFKIIYSLLTFFLFKYLS